MLELVHMIIGICAIVAVGVAVWRSTVGGSIVQAIGPWTVVLVLVMLYGIGDTLLKSPALQQTASTSTSGGKIVTSSLFPDTYSYKEGRESVTASQANQVVESLSSKGVTIAIGIWNGLSTPIAGVGVNIFVILVGIALIVLAWRYLQSQNVLELGMGILTIALVVSLGAGSPSQAWFPRVATQLANSIASAVVEGLKGSFVAAKRQDAGQLSTMELVNAANHARVYPKLRDAMRLYVASARQHGLPVEQLGMVGMDQDGRVPGTFANKYVTFTPGALAELREVDFVVANGYPAVNQAMSKSSQLQRIPGTIVDLYDTSGCYAIYLGGDPQQFIATYLTSPSQNTIFFPNGSTMPPTGSADQAAADNLWLTWQNRLVDGVNLQIGVVQLDGGDGSSAGAALSKAIQTWYADAKRLRLSELEQEYEARKQRAGSGESTTLQQQLDTKRALLEQWCMAPNVRVLTIKPDLQESLEINGRSTGDTRSLGIAVRTALWHSGISNPSQAPSSPIIGRDGPTLAEIVKERQLEHPDAWGAILRGLADGGYQSATSTDASGIAAMRSAVSDIVGPEYERASPPILAVGGFFATGMSREFGRTVRVTGTEDTASWFDQIVGFVSGLYAWMTAFTIYYIVDVAVTILAAVAVAWAPMVVGAALMFAVAFWPVVFCWALLPGRWTLFLDWFKVILWIFSWVPIVIIGRGLINADGIIPEGSYTYAVIQKMLGCSVIFAAPIISKVVIDPSIGGLSGVVGFALRQSVARAGMLVGGGITMAMGTAQAVKAGVEGAATAKPSGGASAPGGSGSGSGSPATGASSGTDAADPAAGGVSSPRARGSSPAASPPSATPASAPAAAGQSFLQGLVGGPANAERLAAGARAAASSAGEQAVAGAQAMRDRYVPQSALGAGDRMANAAVAATSGDPLSPGNQWRGYGSEISNRDVQKGGTGGRGGTGSRPQAALAAIDKAARTGGTSLSKSRILSSEAQREANRSRSEATTGDARQAPLALANAALAETMVAEHEGAIAQNPEASPAERQASEVRADGARLRASNHMAAATKAAGAIDDAAIKAAVAAAVAAIASRLEAASSRTTGSAPKGTT